MINTRKWFSRDAWGAGILYPGSANHLDATKKKNSELNCSGWSTEFMFSLTTWWYILEKPLTCWIEFEWWGQRLPVSIKEPSSSMESCRWFFRAPSVVRWSHLGAWKTHAVDEVDWLSNLTMRKNINLFLNQRPNTYKIIHTVYVCMSICCIVYTVCRELNVCVFICCTLYTT